MTGYDSYTFILCLIVFILLTTFSGIVIGLITKQSLRLIKCGADDDKITKEYYKSLKKKKSCAFDCFFSLTMCIILVVVFAFSLFVGFKKDAYSDTMPTFKVVKTGSMETKNKKNEYLFENDLNNQISTFDLVLIYKKPSMDELKLYDIVVYEVDGIELVHRIVEIEEPCDRHPNERWFKLQGDAVDSPDRFPVKYEQIKGIYKDQHVPFVGSFILFMQSPAGWLCIILVVGAIIITPILEKKLKKAKYNRLVEIGVIVVGEEPEIQLDEDDENYIRPDFLNDNELANALLSIETAVTEDMENSVEEPIIDKEETFPENFNQLKTFSEKLEASPNSIKNIQGEVQDVLLRVENSMLSDSKQFRTFRSRTLPLARFEFRGRTLYVYLGLDPKDYLDSKYIFTDVSDSKQFKNYPMRVILTSDRQADHAKELVFDIAQKHGLGIREIVLSDETEEKTLFIDALPNLPNNIIVLYSLVRNEIENIENVYVVEGFDREFRTDDQPIACMEIIDKSLYVYMAKTPENVDANTDIVIPENRVEEYPFALKLTSFDDVDIVKDVLKIIDEQIGGKK